MTKSPRWFAAVVLLGFLALIAEAAQAQPYSVQLVPQAPRSLETVSVRVTSGGVYFCDTGSVSMGGVSMNANTITVTLACGQLFDLLPPVPISSFDVELGRFPAGSYELVVIEGNPATPAINVAFAVTERHSFAIPYNFNFPVADFTDHWWNPQESGWGISIMQHPSDRLVAAWFVYNQTGQPVWYTLQPGAWTAPTVYTGPVYKTTGPYYAGPFDPRQVGVTQVGTATLSFTDSNTGTFSYTVEGISGSKAITRLPF
jgi:hypothetical protein